MKKNPLEEIYASKVLVSESVPSNKVKGEKELDSMIHGKKAQLVSGQGPEACKKDLEAPEEMEGTKVHSGEPKVLKDSVEEAPKKSFEGSFEKLFKATINEQFPGQDEMSSPEMEMEVEVPTSNDEMMDELEGEADEVSDLVSDLKDLMGKLQSILDKVTEEAGEEKSEDEVEAEFGDEESAEQEVEAEDKDEEPVKEATELKPLGDKSKALQNKNNKVGGHPKVHGGKAQGGDVESDPKLKPAKSFDKALQNVKSKPEVKSTVKKGDFFK
jgi:hypothetical protein